jgi:hypothetical protein
MFMRIDEITNAQDRLELLRLIMDNTWTAIAQQDKAEAAKNQASKSVKALKKPAKPMLNMAAKLGAQAKVKAQQQAQNQVPVQQQHQVNQPVQQVQTVPRQPSQPRPLSNAIKPVSTTQNVSTANNPNMQPQISSAPLKK